MRRSWARGYDACEANLVCVHPHTSRLQKKKKKRKSFLGNFLHIFINIFKLAIHLSFLVFRHVRELFREIANQSLYTSHSIIDFVHLWFCEKFNEKLSLFPLWHFVKIPTGENSETRDEKNDWRDGLRNAIYTLIFSLILPTFFHVLVNLTISI